MNRFKKELRRLGHKTESDYIFLPCDGIEAIEVDTSKARRSVYYDTVGWLHYYYDRNMTCKIVDSTEVFDNE